VSGQFCDTTRSTRTITIATFASNVLACHNEQVSGKTLWGRGELKTNSKKVVESFGNEKKITQ